MDTLPVFQLERTYKAGVDMTDEERAGKYAKEKEFGMFVADRSAREMITQAYLDGMRDERKLLVESDEVCWQGDMDATIAQNLELKKQIEKMKRCMNCKHLLEHNKPLCRSCTHDGTHIHSGKETDKWELME